MKKKEKIAIFLQKTYKKLTGTECCILYTRLPGKYSKKTETVNYNGMKDQKNCPFCKINSQEIIKQYKNFYLIYNKYPYLNTKKHLLIVPKRHINK